MNDMNSELNDMSPGLLVWLVAIVALISIAVTPVPSEAAPAHDAFAAVSDSGKLPPCPSMFKCSVE